MNLNKRDDESQLQHHKRIIYGKLSDKTLSDIDYSELSKYAYGKAYSSDVSRRMFYGSYRTMKLIEEEAIVKNASSDIQSQIETLKKEQQKFYDQRREYNKLLSEQGRFEYICDKLSESVRNLNKTMPLDANREYDNLCVPCSEKDAVLVLSDWHYGLITDNIFNKYNKDICVERAFKIVKATKDRIKLHRCKTLHIIVLGDLVHGAIHVGARVASEELVTDQLMQSTELLAQVINDLSTCVDNVTVSCTYGNHARVVANKAESIHRDNFERLVPWYLEQRFQNSNNVTVLSDQGTEFLTCCIGRHGFVATHGDLDNVKSAAEDMIPLFQNKFKEFYDANLSYILIGDKHHRESYEAFGVTSIICGSLCGTDDYANTKRLYSTPSQLLLIVDPEYGVDAEYTLKC